jgi:hypothetical protein
MFEEWLTIELKFATPEELVLKGIFHNNQRGTP